LKYHYPIESALFITFLVINFYFLAIVKMFSGSSAYLGGNSGRPNPQQFGGSFNQPPSLQPQGSNTFSSQPTGFGQASPSFQNVIGSTQPQPEGFPQSQMQQQYTGFSNGQQAHQYNQLSQLQSHPLGIPPTPTAQQSQSTKPQPTGFTQMAASFQNVGGTAKPKDRRILKSTTKIPNIRLSFITAKDQAQFETLFKSAVGSEQTLSGEKSRDILLRSGLDGDSLSQIWYE
jgi:actin cytoskeleton-regulatory complex protein PAN1